MVSVNSRIGTFLAVLFLSQFYSGYGLQCYVCKPGFEESMTVTAKRIYKAWNTRLSTMFPNLSVIPSCDKFIKGEKEFKQNCPVAVGTPTCLSAYQDFPKIDYEFEVRTCGFLADGVVANCTDTDLGYVCHCTADYCNSASTSGKMGLAVLITLTLGLKKLFN